MAAVNSFTGADKPDEFRKKPHPIWIKVTLQREKSNAKKEMFTT